MIERVRIKGRLGAHDTTVDPGKTTQGRGLSDVAVALECARNGHSTGVCAASPFVMIAMKPEIADIEGGIEIQYCDGKLGEPGHDKWITLGAQPDAAPEYSPGALNLDGKGDVGFGRYPKTKALGLIP